MEEPNPGEQVLEKVCLELPYIPDFLLKDVVFWFAPSRESPAEVYHELTGPSANDWNDYYTKKGIRFLNSRTPNAEGPFSSSPEEIEVRILQPGRLFSPKPMFRFRWGEKGIPLASMQKQKPLNPWKPNYIQALNFIRKYEWPHPLPRSVHYAIWEIEECGQVAGSVSWQNGEAILRKNESTELRETLADLFYNRPEDYPLGSEVYLRVLGSGSPEGFQTLLKLADHPISRKRKIVANTLRALGNPEAIPDVLKLLEDEDPEVRTAALRAAGSVGIRDEQDPEGKIRSYLESDETRKRVWAAQALYRGGDTSHGKFLVSLVKEEPRLLTDMGELGDVLANLNLVDAVPYCIQRLKHPKAEFRADAAEALGRITGLDLEYQSLDTDEQRRKAIRTYSRWWDEKKKTRRKSR